MVNHRLPSTIDRSGRLHILPWKPLETHTASAFTLAGASLLASLFVPIGLLALTEWSWLVGMVLAGLAVVATAVGLFGLYPRADSRSPRLTKAGAVSALVAGAAGSVLLVLSGLTVVAITLTGFEVSVGMRPFAILALAMASGYALGFLSFGIAGRRGDELSGRTSQLLAGGGTLLLVPVVGGLLQLGLGIGLPPWLLFPVLGLVAIDTVAVGVSLRSASDPLAGRSG